MSHRPSFLAGALALAVGLAAAPAAFAAGGMPEFYTEVVCLLAACGFMGYLSFRLGLVPILGFLIAGVALNALGLVRDPALVEAMAELGVILLLFTIGIEFSIESLMRIRRLIFVGGGLQVGLTIALVWGAMALCGVSWQAGLFTGMLVSLSSTAIVLKLLEGRGETRTERGQLGVGMLIFQDLAVVAMVIAVPLLGTGGEGGTLQDKLLSLGMAVAVIAAVLVLARRLVPKLLEALARTCSPEVFLLGVIAICLGTAFLTGFAGVSLSLGAFLAGLLVSESRFGSQALGEILPLQILFSAIFFVSVGLLLDVGFLLTNLPLVLIVVAAVLLLKAAVTTLSAKVLGTAGGVSLATGLMLAQVGEFSFVLERAGREAGLSPADLGTAGGQTFIASTVVLMALTPFLTQAGAALERRLGAEKAMPRPGGDSSEDRGEGLAGEKAAGHETPSGHVLILGYGRSARWLSRRLAEEEIPQLVLTLSPTGARHAEEGGIPVIRGDYTKRSLLQEGGLAGAHLVVVADDSLEVAERAVQLVRGAAPEVPVLAKMSLEEDLGALRKLGATFTVSEEGAAHSSLLAEILEKLGRSPKTAYSESQEREEDEMREGDEGRSGVVELSERQRQSENCTHQDQARAVAPEAEDVCPQCVALGDRWVHLRVCMTCGHVGCCDSSKNRHASGHAASSGHPIVKSMEPGENWAWCFVDDALL